LGELFANVDLVLPGLLGPEKAFTASFRTPIEKNGDTARSKLLETRLKPFMLRRTKDQVATDLPAKTEITRSIVLEGPQRDLYETLRLAMHKKVRDAVKARGIKQSSIIVLDALLKLRQACCDPALVKLPSALKVKSSAKRELLMSMLTELLAEGRRVLVFSQFTEMLNLIERDIIAEKIGYTRLDGDTKDRRAPVERFQSLAVPVMLVSLKAGGVGLNLTAADTVIHYDPWWNPAVENQATDRAHRIGQDKAVFVYKLVCRDTVEEKIIAMQAKKAALASAILAGGSSSALHWDAAAIAELFGA
jgi:SNF2 family DNA or RNA helicase